MQNPSLIQYELHSAPPYQSASPVVVICGTSLFMTIIETGLQAEPNLQVFRLDPACPHTAERMNHLRPTAIITDCIYQKAGFLETNPLMICLQACSTVDASQHTHQSMCEYTKRQADQTKLIYFERSSNFQTIVLNQKHYAIDHIQDLIDVVLGIEPLCK